ncbi:peroxidase 5-like [Wolffia australiana]
MGLKRGGLLLALALALYLCSPLEAQLTVGFYRTTCPRAELIVREEVNKAFQSDNGIAADFVRMHFHDCFVRGCDGSILLDSKPGNTAEKDSPINNPSLEGFDVIDNAKTRLEAACKGVVSCADIIAFAARDSVRLSKGLFYDVPSGRRDGRVSLSAETFANLPPPTFNLAQLTQMFASKGLTQQEMVTLSGAHSIGKADCSSFSRRLYNFNSTVQTDPSLNPLYAAELKQKCPPGASGTTVPMDPPTPLALDISYYKGLLENRGLFTSDQALMSSPATANQVRANRNNNNLFSTSFTAAMIKMGRIGVLAGSAGEIRLNCRVVN